MNSVNFAKPQMLWLAAACVPLLIGFLIWTWRRKQKAAAQFIRSRLWAQLTIGVSYPRQILKRVLFALAVVLLVFTLARPQIGFIEEEARASGLDILVCFDVSRSMLATDVTPNRLTRAKLAAYDLAGIAKSDRLGLVPFAGNAFLQVPLALDDEAFLQSVRALDTDVIPEQGTAFADAIRESMNAFGKDSTGARAVVILTDGEDHEEGAIEAARAAAKEGVRIFTIGIGTAQGALLQAPDPYGNPIFVKDAEGNAVKSRLNEPALKQLAEAGGGFYLPLQGRRTLQTLYDRGLAPLPKTEFKAGRAREWIERFQWPLGVAILLLMVEFVFPEQALPSRRRNRAPAEAVA